MILLVVFRWRNVIPQSERVKPDCWQILQDVIAGWQNSEQTTQKFLIKIPQFVLNSWSCLLTFSVMTLLVGTIARVSASILFVMWSNKHVDAVIFTHHFLVQDVLQQSKPKCAEWLIVIISAAATNIYHWMLGRMLLWGVNFVVFTVHVLLLDFNEFTFVWAYCCGNTWRTNSWKAEMLAEGTTRQAMYV